VWFVLCHHLTRSRLHLRQHFDHAPARIEQQQHMHRLSDFSKRHDRNGPAIVKYPEIVGTKVNGVVARATMDRDGHRHLIDCGFECLAVHQWTEREDYEQLPHEVSLDHVRPGSRILNLAFQAVFVPEIGHFSR
jgi:hypothetical protein